MNSHFLGNFPTLSSVKAGVAQDCSEPAPCICFNQFWWVRLSLLSAFPLNIVVIKKPEMELAVLLIFCFNISSFGFGTFAHQRKTAGCY